jgi:hypothetical protein
MSFTSPDVINKNLADQIKYLLIIKVANIAVWTSYKKLASHKGIRKKKLKIILDRLGFIDVSQEWGKDLHSIDLLFRHSDKISRYVFKDNKYIKLEEFKYKE